MTQEQAALLKAIIKADLAHRGSHAAGVWLNKACTGYSLRTGQVLAQHGLCHLLEIDGRNYAFLHLP